MANLNGQIAQLHTLKPSTTGKQSKADEHSNNVVVMLQGRLANASMGFKDVLEIRTNNMKAAKERGQVFGDSAPHASQGNSSLTAGPSGKCSIGCMHRESSWSDHIKGCGPANLSLQTRRFTTRATNKPTIQKAKLKSMAWIPHNSHPLSPSQTFCLSIWVAICNRWT